MASDNHKKNHQEKIQQVATPSALLQTYTRGRSTQRKQHVRLQRKSGLGLGIPEGKPPRLCIKVTVYHRDRQPIISL